jgi:hypothetical protein
MPVYACSGLLEAGIGSLREEPASPPFAASYALADPWPTLGVRINFPSSREGES